MSDDVNENRCIQVKEAAEKIMETEGGVSIGWMNGETGNSLLTMCQSAYTMLMMKMLREGMQQDEAQKLAQMQAPLLLFELGRRVGSELEATRAFREMFGDDDG